MEKDRSGMRHSVSPLGSDFYRQKHHYFVSSLNDGVSQQNNHNQKDLTPSSALMNDFQKMLTQGQGSIFGGASVTAPAVKPNNAPTPSQTAFQQPLPQLQQDDSQHEGLKLIQSLQGQIRSSTNNNFFSAGRPSWSNMGGSGSARALLDTSRVHQSFETESERGARTSKERNSSATAAHNAAISGPVIAGNVGHQENSFGGGLGTAISPISTMIRMKPNKSLCEPDRALTPASVTRYITTPYRTRKQLESVAGGSSQQVSPFQQRRPRITTGGDFKDAMSSIMQTQQQQPSISPIRGLTRLGSSIMQANNKTLHYPFMHRNASNSTTNVHTIAQLAAQGGSGGFTAPSTDPSKPAYNTPMIIRPYLPSIYQPSPNLDDQRPRLTLQMSLPQMSEIPNEERVQYAYQKQMELQQKINGHNQAARVALEHDGILQNTPTASGKPGEGKTMIERQPLNQIADFSPEEGQSPTVQQQEQQNRVQVRGSGARPPSGKTTQMSTPKPLLSSKVQLVNRRQTSSNSQKQSPQMANRRANLKLLKNNSATGSKNNGNNSGASPKQQLQGRQALAVPGKLTSRQHRKQSEQSETSMLKIGRRASSSNRSYKEVDMKQVGSGKNATNSPGAPKEKKSRKKAAEKTAAKMKRALKHSNSNESEIVSPDFGGNLIAAKRGRKSSQSPDQQRESPISSLKQTKPKLQLQLQLQLRPTQPMALPDKCQCSRSRCLKLYCECFAKGSFCRPECGCQNCFNKAGEEDAIAAAKADICKRDPLAFVKKLELNKNKQTLQHRKGCTCKRSGCKKGYCECFQLGVACTDWCKCTHCQNTGPPAQESKNQPAQPQVKKQRSLAESSTGAKSVAQGKASGNHEDNTILARTAKAEKSSAATRGKNKASAQASVQLKPTAAASKGSKQATVQLQTRNKRKVVSVASIAPAQAPLATPAQQQATLKPKRSNSAHKK